MSRLALVAADVVAMGVVHAGTGYLAHRLPPGVFERDRWIFRERAVEGGGRTYVTRLRIRRWKGRLPEAGDLFAGGFNKARLAATSDDYLLTYLRETRRAETAHWLALACAPMFFAWNPWYAGVAVQVYAVAVNGPCIASQRYNRIRLSRVLSGRARRAARR